jgi:hypothetical protein
MQNIENKMQENVKKFQAMGWNVRAVELYHFSSQSDCLEMVEELSGLKEGVVVYNTKTKMRVKIKNAVYLAAHRLRGQNGLTLNSICELVAMNEQAEYIAVFPDDAPKFEPALAELGVMIDELVTRYNEHKNIETQKDFALMVKDMPQAGVMFTARKNGTSALEEFNKVLVGKKADWLKERLLATKQYKAVLVSEGQLDARCI